MHVHVYSGQGEAKFWLQPNVSLAQRYSLSDKYRLVKSPSCSHCERSEAISWNVTR